uniref:Uncharacterized protein n=1 Tax=Leptocylindrus danicus TaxID=163516 RepID=A0A7S2K0L5_9STRA|mmetsp:Transcript_15491/g.22877  ORF Transcript_15491/g.22877 Transcript_15491/m.22877 type:complete len:147 (+) Transcript_15491:190-630(+)|eukprot:CAMPEP_0116024698 /NCGR_PEP_ID=MMETSP0321-20121206/12501_1 /TAXON_ID=163516 /ORGANISM="Leptocylindrus danicus var. danicus, Strain B650" /LENGTH=146 /DNA_ID=CAMNT_0003496537 /DNA_START=172 /DNA_END=612 /DNA_ORIENTATION=-
MSTKIAVNKKIATALHLSILICNLVLSSASESELSGVQLKRTYLRKEKVKKQKTKRKKSPDKRSPSDPDTAKNTLDSNGSQGPWEDCLGETINYCETLIRAEAPDIDIIDLLEEGMIYTADENLDRVRIFYKKEIPNIVSKVPKRG